jgi:hypothetical protein
MPNQEVIAVPSAKNPFNPVLMMRIHKEKRETEKDSRRTIV